MEDSYVYRAFYKFSMLKFLLLIYYSVSLSISSNIFTIHYILSKISNLLKYSINFSMLKFVSSDSRSFIRSIKFRVLISGYIASRTILPFVIYVLVPALSSETHPLSIFTQIITDIRSSACASDSQSLNTE